MTDSFSHRKPASEHAEHTGDLSGAELEDVVSRVLARARSRADAPAADPAAPVPRAGHDHLGRARELAPEDETHVPSDGDQQDLAERHALRRVAGLSTELEDVTEVEYRQLRLERVVLAGLYSSGTLADAENSLRELAALAETAGSEVMDGMLQRRVNPDPGTYLGSGKALELKDVVAATGADTVIVDAELAPSQRRALEDVVKVKVIDRTGLILDIFAQHAKSKEGKAQVELAQLEYMLPRLRGWGESLSRQAGGRAASGEGIGSRGPGETKIELDRRRIRQRMAKLRREIAAMKPARETKRLNRRRNAVPSVAIAGYTNAGKSSLLNRLTDAGVLVENALFATLDPTVRKAQTPDGIGYTLADTVGFVRSLPTQLVEAFRSTLEEVADSDVIVHVVDASHPDPEGQLKAVRDVLTDVGANDIPEIVALNKADIADLVVLARLRNHEHPSVAVSARTGEGIEELQRLISAAIPRPDHELDLLIPYVHGEVVSRLHAQDAEILSTEHTPEGTRLHVRVRQDLLADLEAYRCDTAAGRDEPGQDAPERGVPDHGDPAREATAAEHPAGAPSSEDQPSA
ncbi:GTPase HflX [Kocuria sp.]|uniref:GTPase HflX n=1 Tax=Kocuria sp. TaxID=1871328 RepID=UPI0026DAB0FB|nr:GTPase HflX [Kocuria sp.]MDO4919537.1 GTPase HflX [Kocuria sp.]